MGIFSDEICGENSYRPFVLKLFSAKIVEFIG
jgi:hypothetical protein